MTSIRYYPDLTVFIFLTDNSVSGTRSIGDEKRDVRSIGTKFRKSIRI